MIRHTALPKAALLLCLLIAAALPASATRVLYLGDSMSMGSFGKTFDGKLRAAGNEVYSYATGGATPYYWLKEFDTYSSDIGYWVKTPASEKRTKGVKAVPKMEDLISRIDPDVVVVQTGANLYSVLRNKQQNATERVQTVEYLVDRMCRAAVAGGRRVYWITPPDSHEKKFSRELQNQMREIMKRVVGRYGRVFDSWTVTKFRDPWPETDGIHYGPEEAAAWAGTAAGDFNSWSAKVSWKRRSQDKNGSAGEEADGGETIRKAKPVDGAPGNAVTATLRLVKKSEFEMPSEISYKNALAVYEYEVLRVEQGKYPYKKMRVAHMVMYNRKILQPRDWKTGGVISMEVVPLATYPNVEKIETLDDLPEDTKLPIFTPRL